METEDAKDTPQQSEGQTKEVAFAADLDYPICPQGIAIGQLRDYLLHLRTSTDMNESVTTLGLHAAECLVCQERVEELNLLEDALRNKSDFQHLVPLIKANVIEPLQQRGSGPLRTLQSQVARKFAGRIVAVQRGGLESIAALDAEYDRVFRSKSELVELQTRCSERFEELQPLQKETAQEYMIDILARHEARGVAQQTPMKLDDIIESPADVFGLLLKVTSIASTAGRRAWTIDETSSTHPSDVMIDMEAVIPA